MKLDLQTHKLSLAEATRSWIRTRFAYALGRFAPRIARLRVRMLDANGPRGGLDKVCRIHVQGRGFGPLLVQSVAADPATAAAHRGLGPQPAGLHVGPSADQKGPRPLCSLGLPVPLGRGESERSGELHGPRISRTPRGFAALATLGADRAARVDARALERRRRQTHDVGGLGGAA